MSGKKKAKKSHLWERDPHDWYVENTWADEGLFAKVQFEGPIIDPCCGMGRVLDAAQDAGYETLGYDIIDRGAGKRHPFLIRDFFTAEIPAINIACNPPYKYDDEFVRRAVAMTQRKCAILLNAQWANGSERSLWLETLPLAAVYAITPRPSMPPGAVIMGGEAAGNGMKDYSWYVFERGYPSISEGGNPQFGWVRRPPRPKKPKRGNGDQNGRNK